MALASPSRSEVFHTMTPRLPMRCVRWTAWPQRLAEQRERAITKAAVMATCRIADSALAAAVMGRALGILGFHVSTAAE
jgi:hypothetical protein